MFLALFSSYHRVWQTSGCSWFYKGPKLSRRKFLNCWDPFFGTQDVDRNKLFLKKLLSRWQKFLARFHPYIACEKPQGTTFKGPQAIATNIVEPMKRLFLGTKRLLEKQRFEKKSAKNRFWLNFCRFIEHEKSHGTYCMRTKGVCTLMVQMVRSFLWDLRGR